MELLQGTLPRFFGEYDRDWLTYNAQLVAVYGQVTWPDLVQLLCLTQQRLVDLLVSMPTACFDEDYGVCFRGRPVTVARLLRAEVDDEKVHYQQLKRFSDTCQPYP